MDDLISREDVKRLTTKRNSIWNKITDTEGRGLDEILDYIPSAGQYKDYEIQRMQDIEQAQIEKAYDLGYAEGKADEVPVVRCKDCKYAHMTYDGDCKYCDVWFPDEAEYLDGDYYCASAERKES